MTTEELRIIVKAEVDQAIASLQKTEVAEAAVAKTGGSVVSAFTSQAKAGLNVGQALTDLATKAGGVLVLAEAVKKLGEFMVDSAKEYLEAEASAAKLEAIYRATGGTVGFTTGQLESMAEQMQGVTGIEKDLIQNAEGILLSFRSIKGDNFKGATQAAVDLSAALGMDASSAAMSLGKALESPTEGMQNLRREGVVLSDQTMSLVKSMEAAGNVSGAQALILKEVEDRYGGVAKAMGDTAGGGLKKLSNAWKDLKENIGQSIVEGIRPFVGGLAEIIEKMNEINGHKLNVDKVIATGGLSGDVQAARDEIYAQLADVNARLARSSKNPNDPLGYEQTLALQGELAALQKKRQAIESITYAQMQGASAQAVAAVAQDAQERSWQNWFEKITGVSQSLFVNASQSDESAGHRAATLYLQGLEAGFSGDDKLAAILGEKLDPLPYLEKEQAAIKKTVEDLISIPRPKISNPFEAHDDSIKVLTAKYKGLAAAINEANEAASLKSDLESVKSPWDKYMESMAKINNVRGAGDITQDQYTKLSEKYMKEYYSAVELATGSVKELGQAEKDVKQVSFNEWISQGTAALLEHLGVAKDVASVYGDLAGKIASISISGTVDAFNQLGAAFQDGKISGEELGAAIASLAKKILDELPMMFVQAGLQIIGTNLALGLALITAGLTSSFIAGLAGGTSSSSSSTTQSAKGNVFDSGSLVRYATGGTFTNSLVTRPTRFSLGEMGEKGPEAIMPLERLSDGSLGVRANGSETPTTTVNIHNYSGQDVSTKTSGRGSSRSMEIMVGSLVDANLSSGRHDRALMGRYTVRRQVTRG